MNEIAVSHIASMLRTRFFPWTPRNSSAHPSIQQQISPNPCVHLAHLAVLCLTSLQTPHPAFLKPSLLMLAFLLSFQLAFFNSFLGSKALLPTPPPSWCSCCRDVAQLHKWAQGQCCCPALPSLFGIVMCSHGLPTPRYQDHLTFFFFFKWTPVYHM